MIFKIISLSESGEHL